MSSRQYSDSLRVGILLALTGGFLDAYTYISRGNVFANAQTGNMVMLGINFMEGNFRGIINYIIPIIAFAIGVLLAEVIRTKLSKSEKLHWRQAVLAIEIILLISVAFIPFDYVANTIISFICAMQVESFRKFHGNAYATTMCTGNLRSGTEKLVICNMFYSTIFSASVIHLYIHRNPWRNWCRTFCKIWLAGSI